MTTVRLLIDPPAPGAWNMAVDETLLETAASEGIATLRFYEWDEPTLSLGYFQSAADREQHSASRNCPLVRRASGGGAILHDRELTYSVALPLSDVRSSKAQAIYDACHQSLLEALGKFGVAASLYELQCEQDSVPVAPPFLCFQRRTCTDVVCGDVKIAGSAQRRRRGAVLQHGSILISQSRWAPELPGIREITNVAISPAELASRWKYRLADRLGLALGPAAELSAAERDQAATLATSRFAGPRYVFRR